MSDTVLASAAAAAAAVDDSDYDDYPDVEPVFITKPSVFSVKKDDTLVLPCDVKDLGTCTVSRARFSIS